MLLAGLENPWWDRIVLGLIFLNTIQLLVTDPLDVPDMRPQSATRDAFESVGLFFTWVFTIECFLKIFALGFIRGHGTYLANGWNWLDFFIVCVGLIEIIVPNAGNLTALRALRVMRPLRAITRFPELQALVMLLLNCIPQLSNVIILCLFIFFVFGILGVQLFKGCFRGRCYSVEDGATTDEMCSLATNGGMAMCGDMRECLQLGENSGREMVRFDDIGGAIAAIFQLMTTEGWADMMYETQDTVGRWTFAYYVVLMFAGPICAVNLFLVVMSEQFAKTEEAKKAAEQRERDLEKAMTVTEMAMAPDGTQDSTQGQHTDDHNKNHGDKSANIQRARRASQDLSEHSLPRKMSAPGDPAGTSAVLSRGQSAATAVSTVAPLQRENSSLMADMPQDLSALQKAQRRASLSGRTGSMRSMDAGTQSNAPGAPADPAAPGLISEQSELEGGQRRKKPIWRRVQWQLRIWAKSDGLQNFVLSVIVLNTIVMASDMKCEFDGSDDWCKPYKAVLEMFNIFFALVFTVELVIKMVGLGPRGYAASRMNLFDGLIVLVSDYEIISANSPGIVACYLGPCPSPDLCNACPGEGGGFAVLRAFRLVRLVKLLRAFPDLQKQVKVLGEVMQSIVWLIILVMILVLIFFVLGMNLFGGQVAGPWDPEELPIALGSFVWVTFPNDVTSAPSLGRYGRVMGVDVENRTFSQWHVYIKYGEDVANKELFQGRLGLDSEGKVWCATQDDVDTGLIGMPYISSLPIRLSFDNAWLSAITTFQLITMANWNDNLYDVTGTTGNTGYALYFYALITVGNWMLLNLFIAILIQKFAEQKAIALAENITRMHESMVKEFGNLTEDEVYDKAEKLFDSYDTSGDGEIDKYEFRDALATIGVELGQRELVNLVQQYDTDKSGAIDFSEFFCMIMQLLEEAKTTIAGEADQGKSSSPEPAAEGVASPDHQKSPEPRSPEVAPIKVDKDRVEKMAQMKRANSLQNMRERGEEHKIPKTCWVLRDRHPLRLMCRRIAQSKPLDQVVLAAIGASCCCLVIERPDIGDDSPERAVLKVVDIILNTIFTFEFLVKMIDQTFTGYLKSGWNRLDFMIVFTSAIDMFVTYALASLDVDIGALKMFRVFRIFRALRPLRIIARMRGLRILVSTLMSSAKPVAQTCAIAGGVFLIGGILGMQFLMGKMDSCSDGMVSQQDDCIGLDDDGEQRTWGGYYVNFDNTYRSMISMFIIATQDDWVSHMWAGIDATEARQGPFQNNAPAISIFYIGMIFASALVVVNIFVGVFVDCYLAASAEMDASQDPDLKPVRPKVNQVYNDPDRGFKKHVFQTISHTKFDMFIAFFIVTNVISMAFDTFKPHQWQQDFDVIANFFYTIIFGWECLFKMYCLNSRRYFVSGWNKFDFFIVMVSFGGIFIDSLGNAVPINPTVLRILRIFRIFRILRAFRIFKSLKGLQAIVMTLGSSLPAIMNLFSFLMLLFFIYSIIGVMVFGSLCRDGDQGLDGLQAVRCLLSPEDLLLDPHATFETVMWSLLTLFRVATGDAWGDILDQCAAEAPHGPSEPPARARFALVSPFCVANGNEPQRPRMTSKHATTFLNQNVWNKMFLSFLTLRHVGSVTAPAPPPTAVLLTNCGVCGRFSAGALRDLVGAEAPTW